MTTTRNYQTGGAGHMGARTSMETVILCRNCARKRDRAFWLAGIIIVVIVVSGIVFTISLCMGIGGK